ncbi:MAG: biopolymer transporter ExbD [Planctomycetaceae bacterium]|nr:MAG: biopolymer transporter ExbD [Planctomycetaceae bacterium]
MNQTVAEPDDEDEDPVRMSPKRADEEEIDITPMIDIVFLLLIFFVVTSKMDPTQMGRIPKAEAGLAVSAKDSAVIFISPAGVDAAIITDIDGNEFSTDEELLATEIVEYVTEELDKGRNQVMILADEDTKVADVTRVQKIIGDAFETLENTFIAVKEE